MKLVISLRERNNRQHTEFERRLNAVRDDLKTSFNSFAADTQRAYQQLRQEIHGEKRIALALLNELMEIGLDLEQIVAVRPTVLPTPEIAAQTAMAEKRGMPAVNATEKEFRAEEARRGRKVEKQSKEKKKNRRD